MATTLAASTYTVFATVLGVRYELSVTVRMGSYARFADNNQAVSPEQLAGMTAHTIATWQRVIEAVMNGSYEIAPFAGHEWPSAQAKQGVSIEESEPFVTVWNKEWNSKGLGITVHSWDNGTTALFAAYSMLQGIEKLAPYADKFGIEKLEFAPLHKTPTPKPSAAPKRDIDDVDSFLNDPATHGVTPPQASAKQGNVYVRPAMAGSIPNTIKLQKGAKGKETFEMAILPTTPYSSNAADFQEKDLIAYPIQGAIRYEGGSSGFYFAIPVPQSEIRVYVREATNFDGKTIESDSQKLAQHLGLKDMELSQGMKWNVPATHIAMKVGKVGNKGQFKNYQGLYELK